MQITRLSGAEKRGPALYMRDGVSIPLIPKRIHSEGRNRRMAVFLRNFV